MKKIFTLFAALAFVYTANAQIVINEILYNIPGTGELEEFIEIHNAGSSPVNMNNYTFTQGVTYTFPNISIPAGGYYIICEDSMAFYTSFGISTDGVWVGALSNGGEDITLRDGLGAFVDSVDYEPTAPWPLEAAGQGRSLQLCDPMTDNNNGANWGITNVANGYNTQSTTDSLYATPGTANVCQAAPPPPPVSYPLYTFDQVNDIDGSGVADSLGVTCELRGIAHCLDYRGGTGYDFPFANSNNSAGIRLFSFNDLNTYSFTAGDSLHVFGTVTQFNGLLQFDPDSIYLVSQGNNTASAITVTTVTETYENRYVAITGVHIVDTSAWTGTGSGFNVQVTDGSSDTTTVRIDNDNPYYSQPAPLGTFDIYGWGGQFDSSIPRTEGYQLLPCEMGIITSTEQVFETNSEINVYPNPAKNSINFNSSINNIVVEIFDITGKTLKTVNASNTITSIALNSFANGVYFYTITDSKGKTIATNKFIVAK